MFMVRDQSGALAGRDVCRTRAHPWRLNDEPRRTIPPGMFDVLCAVFEPKSGRLVTANGGHCKPVLLPAGGAPQWAVKIGAGFRAGVGV